MSRLPTPKFVRLLLAYTQHSLPSLFTHTLSLDETKFLGSEEDCEFVDSTFQTRAKYCVTGCSQTGTMTDNVETIPGGVYSTLAYNSPFGRNLDDLRIDIRSIEVDGDVVLFDDLFLNHNVNVSCTCDGEVTVFDDCASPNIVCSAKYLLEPTLRVQWAASLDTKLQTATSTLTLFVNNSGSSPSNITVAVGFDKAFKASADGKPLSYSTKTKTASVFMHGENDEEQEIKDSKLVVEPEVPQGNNLPPSGVTVRPAQKVVFVSVPTEMDSYSVGIVSTLSVVSSAVIVDATYSFALFLILQLSVSPW